MKDQLEGFQSRFNVSRETLERLEVYHNLLLKWNPRINLVSPKTLEDAWSRHFVDSAQLFDLAPEDADHWADLGSGGGFPGAVVGILAAERRPGLLVTLIESDQRKSVFLRTVARETDIKLHVVSERIETAISCECDILSARALAPLSKLLEFAERHLKPTGIALFPKGRNHASELANALENWRFDCETYVSETDSEAVILKIGGIGRG